ncbi:unnamed protein product [Dibothriocephalus latus]|uniref:Uncharacterized protein n=1 Tax=Dibothriocephalus latus TaxID=60516 RepID=A0A3P7MVJ4_DIBLA|nr:unnamed protein product [Dibothriocephalus latus]
MLLCLISAHDLQGSGVRLQTYLPCLISTEFTKVPASKPFVPSADVFAAAAWTCWELSRIVVVTFIMMY